MNEQKAPKGIEWTRVINPDGSIRKGFTWNPIGGCHHGCQWIMSDGNIAQCYAKTIAESMNKRFGKYEQGFEHHYWYPERLDQPLKVKQPSGIFLDSMSDLMGHWVEDWQIQKVLDVCADASQHIFFLLTKNPRRLKNFRYPKNVWVGASSPPDIYMSQVLSDHQKQRLMAITLASLAETNATVKWVSFEPLSNDYSPHLKINPDVLDWAVIGAASNGRKHFPPDKWYFNKMLSVLDKRQIPVFFKVNRNSLPEAVADWREAFPTLNSLGSDNGIQTT